MKYEQCQHFYDMLRDFQDLSISGTLEEALIAYEGEYLTEAQIEALGKIHESTNNWMKGELADTILTHLKETKNGKDIRELSQTLMSLMGMEGGDTSKMMKKIEAYVVNA